MGRCKWVGVIGMFLLLSTAQAQQGDYRSLMADWRREAVQVLQAQPRNAPVRTAIDDWLRDQRDSLSSVPEGLRAHAAKVKLFASAGFTLDRAVEHQTTLTPVEHRALVALSERMLDDCAKFVGPGRGQCRDGNAVVLRVQQALALARREEDDLPVQMARIEALMGTGIEAERGDADAYCSGLLRIAALQQLPERFVDQRLETHGRFFRAFEPAAWVRQCLQAGARLDKLTHFLARFSDGSLRVAAALGQDLASARQPWLALWAQVAAATPPNAQSDGSPLPLNQLVQQAALAQWRGDGAVAADLAKGLPAALQRFGPDEMARGCFVLRYGAENWPESWPALMSRQPTLDAELRRACPPR